MGKINEDNYTIYNQDTPWTKEQIQTLNEISKQQLWIKVALAYVSSGNATKKEGAAKWADQIVKDFEERFSKE